MNLVSLTVCKNEAWVIGASLRIALKWCDHAVVLLHDCSDRTPEIVQDIATEHPNRVKVLTAHGATWTEMEHRQRTLQAARDLGATHCAVVDADEILAGDLLPTIRATVSEPMRGCFYGIPMRNLHGSLDLYRSDPGIWGQRAGTMLAFTDRNDLCWRAERGYDYHSRSPRNSQRSGMMTGASGILHLQFASRRRLLAKHAWYKMVERVRYPGKAVSDIDRLYSMAPSEDGVQTSPCPESWWEPYRDLRQFIDVDAEPWQERACRDMLARHGARTFAGLDLFGVVEEVAA